MIESDLARSPGDIMGEIADLKRAVRELQAGRRLEAATIKDGALVVLDAASAERIRLGRLADASFGLEVVDPVAGRVKLSTLAFGPTATADPDDGTRTGSIAFDWGDLTGSSGGPSATVTVGSSGKALVFISAYAQMSAVDDDGRAAYIGFEISGATSRAPDANPPAGMDFTPTVGDVVSVAGTIGRHALVSGLTPGSHTFTMKYASWGVSAGSGTATFLTRDIAVFPY